MIDTANFNHDTYDYIIVGAGTTGPVVASRLSEDATVRVAILEAGGENTNDVSRMAGAFSKVWGTDYDWQYNTVAQKELNNRIIYQPRGRVVGGSGAINVGAWLRGASWDYEWESLGAHGWTWENAKRLFTTKIEDTDRGPTEYRGRGGMMYVRDAMAQSDITDRLIDAYVQAGFGGQTDFSGPDPYNADRFQVIYKDNVRRTTADAYLSEKIRERKNLTVIPNAFVTRVIFDGTRATGVEFIKDGKTKKMPATKEIILCAGAYNTPKLLKLSGIGPRSELEKHNIKVIADVPGVGENLSDHIMIEIKVVSPKGIEYGFAPDESTSNQALAQWRKNKTGPANYFNSDSIGLMQLDKTSERPDFELIFGNSRDLNRKMSGFENIKDLNSRSGYSVGVVLLHPKSRGNVLLASDNPTDKPIINPNYLGHPDDIKTLVKGVRKTMLLFNMAAIQSFTENIHISPLSSDKAIEEFIRNEAGSVFHPVGTIKMGDLKDQMVVVDNELRIRGIQGVRVADASVIQMLNSGHTMAPSIYIGERAAEIIKQK